MANELKQKIETFLSDFQNLISQSRLNSYGNAIKHQENISLIAQITPNLALLELSLRNLIDFVLKEKKGLNWLNVLRQCYEKQNSKTDFENKLLQELLKIEKKYGKHAMLTHEQYISNLTLGFWVRLADEFKICSMLFNPEQLKFKEYAAKNENRDISKSQKHWKVIYAMNLLLIIRNKAYHWENLLKLNGKQLPNITYLHNRNRNNSHKLFASIHPDKIKIFLEDFLKAISLKLWEFYQQCHTT